MNANYQDRSIKALVLGSAFLLLALGVPRFLAALSLVPGTPVFYALWAGEPTSAQDIDTMITSRLQSLEFSESPAAYSDLGAAYLAQAQQAETPDEKQRSLELSLEMSGKSVALAPLNAYAWARIANANIMLSPPKPEAAVTAWRQSIETARYEPVLLFQRFHLGVVLYRDMSPADIALLKDQTRMAYNWWPYNFRSYCRRKGLVEWAIVLLADNPEAVAYLAP